MSTSGSSTPTSFYRAFEDRYRGSREAITARLHAYDAFIAPLAALYQPAGALDLGCGRGEWLELLGQAGFDAGGVDLDEGMLAACRERHLRVATADAVASLRALPDASLALVSAFHLVEHIPFGMVQQMIEEALRVLRPGGLLIMETPNPENLVVGASSFYMDPSHLRPLPPNLLAFAVEHAGFARHAVLRLQEAPQLHGGAPIELMTVLDGVSPDYSVVAQKAGAPEPLARFDAPFGAGYGVDLATLARRYEAQEAHHRFEIHSALGRVDQRLTADVVALGQAAARHVQLTDDIDARLGRGEGRLAQGEAQLARHEARHAQAEARQSLAEARQERADARLAQAEAGQEQADARLGLAEAGLEARIAHVAAQLAQIDARAAQAEERAAHMAQRVADLLASSSWRITAPLRMLGAYSERWRLAREQGRIGSGLRRRAGLFVRPLVHSVLMRPRLKQAAHRVLLRFPALHARLFKLMYRNDQHHYAAAPDSAPLGDMSPRTLHIYRALQKAREARKN